MPQPQERGRVHGLRLARRELTTRGQRFYRRADAHRRARVGKVQVLQDAVRGRAALGGGELARAG